MTGTHPGKSGIKDISLDDCLVLPLEAGDGHLNQRNWLYGGIKYHTLRRLKIGQLRYEVKERLKMTR
jgi:hypothetical protein